MNKVNLIKMKKNSYLLIYSLVLIGILLMFFNACKKENNETIPSLTTSTVTDINSTTATCGGNITDNGGSEITARGVCWNTTGTPTILDKSTSDGTGTGTFTSSLNGLTQNTTYYVRAYATNSKGTGYGNQVNFTIESEVTLPTVHTSLATNITQTTVTLNAYITSDGGAEITQRGFYWSKSNTEPNINDNVVTVNDTASNFSTTLTLLQPDATYYFTAFASNSAGTSSSYPLNFTTYGSFTDPRDGKNYNTITIGGQSWLAENLAFLPDVSPPWEESYIDSLFYVYGYEGTSVSEAKAGINYQTYGALYNWPAARASCPPGWHLPTDDDWKQLEMAIGMRQIQADSTDFRGTDEGKKIKATSGWFYNGNGTNETGFSALPAGYRNHLNSFYGVELTGLWWSDTEYIGTSGSLAWCRGLTYSNAMIKRFYDWKERGYSIRCVKGD